MAQEATCGVCGRRLDTYDRCEPCFERAKRHSPPPGEDAGEEKSDGPYTRAQVLGWKRKAEAYEVLLECFERLEEHQDKASPITEAMLDAVIEAKRLREQVKSGGVG